MQLIDGDNKHRCYWCNLPDELFAAYPECDRIVKTSRVINKMRADLLENNEFFKDFMQRNDDK